MSRLIPASQIVIGQTIKLADGDTAKVKGRAWQESILHRAQGRVREANIIYLFFEGLPALELKPTDSVEVVQDA